MAFSYYSPETVQTGQVPSTQTDFPILINVTDARFKTVGNGGHVQNSSGFDIRPYSDSGLTTALTYELERYNASTGEVVMWVKRSSLADGNVTYLAYGDSSLTTDGSSTATWSNGFLAVYHLGNGATLSVNSSTGTNNGTNNGGTAVTGKIDGGLGLASTSSQYVDLGSALNPAAMTISAWVKGTTFPNDYNGTVTKGQSGADWAGIYVKTDGKLFCTFRDNLGNTRGYDGTGTNTLVTGTWYYLAETYDTADAMRGYVNGSQDGTTLSGPALDSALRGAAIGRQQSTATRYFNGVIDEVRIASVARSANWLTTEYNNQNAPGTFSTLGSEVAITGGTLNTKSITGVLSSSATLTSSKTIRYTLTLTGTLGAGVSGISESWGVIE